MRAPDRAHGGLGEDDEIASVSLGALEKPDQPLDDLRAAVGSLDGPELGRADRDKPRDGLLSLTPSPFQGEGRGESLSLSPIGGEGRSSSRGAPSAEARAESMRGRCVAARAGLLVVRGR